MQTVIISSRESREENETSIEMLRAAGFEVRMLRNDRFAQGLASDGEEIELLHGVSAVVAAGERYPAGVLESLPDLRVIARHGVGFDKVDVAAATESGTILTVTPTANHEAVAEHALALILALAKSLLSRDRLMRAGGWPAGQGRPLRGSTLGVFGLGRIGRSLVVRARAMGMNVIATEPYPDSDFVRDNGVRLVELDSLLETADYVSLHCPLSDETRGIMGRDRLALMKPDAVLVNTARGGLIVEADLLDALRSGRLGGAGLDVFEREPTDPNNPLYELDNVVVSPHVAGSDVLSTKEMGIEAAQCIIDLHSGRWPDGAVINTELKGRWRW